MIKSRMGAIFSAALFAGAFASTSAQAQSGGWEVSASEYKCFSVYRSVGTLRISIYRDHVWSEGAPFMVSMTSTNVLPDWARGAGLGAQIGHHSTTYPTHRVTATTERSGKSDAFGRSLEVPVLQLHGGYDLLDWLAGANRSFDYLYQGRVVETFTLSDFAGARAALDNCRPIAPPPNRAVFPAGNKQDWVDIDALYAVVGDTLSLSPFRANLIVNGEGRVESCTVTTSSGHAEADKVYCDVAKKRARFHAATDALGKHIAATYEFKVGAVTF